MPDGGTPDGALPDSSAPDGAVPDSAVPDSAVPDSGPATTLDVILLLDRTGSHNAELDANIDGIIDDLVRPLLSAGDVRIGVASYADFPIDPYGSIGDRPFIGIMQPGSGAGSVRTAIDGAFAMMGGDGPESVIQALFELAGGTTHAHSTPMSCGSGRVLGGCFRPGSQRAVIVFTDAEGHGAPDGAGIYEPYAASVGAADWSETRSRLIAGGMTLFFHIDRDDPLQTAPPMVSALGDSPSAVIVESSSGTWSASLVSLRTKVIAYSSL